MESFSKDGEMMSAYLNAEFFKRVQTDFRKYENDVEGSMERAEFIEKKERERVSEMEEDYKILDTFGALM